jgi:hypothetical protein
LKKPTFLDGITRVTVLVVVIAGMMIMTNSMQLLSTTTYAQNSTNSTTTPQQEPQIEESLIDADMLKFAFMGLIAQSNITGFNLSPENGTVTFLFEHPGSNGTTMSPLNPLNVTLTITNLLNPGEGFRFENQTIYTPDGRAIRLVIEDNERSVNDEKNETRFFEERGIT